MGKGIFITGTDTGVGKTVVSAALLLGLRGRGVDAGYMKPIATGCAAGGGRLVSPDVEFVRSVCPVEDDELMVNPVRFARPVCPLSASAMEGREVDLSLLLDAFGGLSRRRDILIVEGIGGIAVPIRPGFDLCDLISLFGLPAIVVMKPSLGTVNHAILTVDYARRRSVGVSGLVVNSPVRASGGAAEETGPDLAGRVLGIPVIARVDHDASIAAGDRRSLRAAGSRLAEWALGVFKV